MVAIAAQRTDYAARVLFIAALAGVLVSLYKYFDPASGISGTPGALLVVITSAVIFLIGLSLRKLHRRSAWRRLAMGVCLVLIAGTAFAAYLLESTALLVWMIISLIGWVMHVIGGPSATRAS